MAKNITQIKNYIGGEWTQSSAPEWLPVHNPATAKILAEAIALIRLANPALG